MNIAVWVSLAALLVGTIATFSVAAMHRRQMRQIELHRADPRIPLIPPPHPITRFLKSYGIFLVGFSPNFVLLILDLRNTTPVTRRVVFHIVISTIGCFVTIAGAAALYLFDKVMESAERTWDAMERMSDKIEEASYEGKPAVNSRHQVK